MAYRISEILKTVKGAGEISVMVKLKNSSYVKYAVDSEREIRNVGEITLKSTIIQALCILD
ncbi:hypothetical protein M1N51_00180 [Peptococcaceae bacterium]|nr:hypothetical protein [Peptococcaceae bacterium]MCL0051895.1 hypothetical protein [Peptococcaceae bacterium]MCL0071636.1 hypothetical protein [Peptococcaceae bacterium]MCL0100993.1 hypothetical protein [Peptococcaceae bacterium]